MRITHAVTDARTKRTERCADCWLPLRACVCAELPRIAVATKLVIVMHHVEARRASNTGRLAARILGGTVRLRGEREPSPEAPMPEGRRLLLFPDPTASTLSRAHAVEGPCVLVVPDGNWKQASRVLHRDEAAAGAEIVTLPAGAPSRYRLRRRPNEGALSTFEAIARALALLEGPAIEVEMMRALDLFVERTLVLRGGIPAAGFD